MLVSDLLYDARSLLDDYNSGGIVTPESETAETDANGLRYVYMGLCEIYPYARYYKTHSITQTLTDEQREADLWIPYTLPSDLGTIDRIVLDDSKYSLSDISQLEGYNTLYLSPRYEGTLRVVYKPKPVRLAKTDELPINNPLAEQFMVYYVASRIALTDLPDSANFFAQTALEMKRDAMKPQPASEMSIVDVYGFGG